MLLMCIESSFNGEDLPLTIGKLYEVQFFPETDNTSASVLIYSDIGWNQYGADYSSNDSEQNGIDAMDFLDLFVPEVDYKKFVENDNEEDKEENDNLNHRTDSIKHVEEKHMDGEEDIDNNQVDKNDLVDDNFADKIPFSPKRDFD